VGYSFRVESYCCFHVFVDVLIDAFCIKFVISIYIGGGKNQTPLCRVVFLFFCFFVSGFD